MASPVLSRNHLPAMNSFAELPCAEKGTWLRRHTSYIRFVGGVLLRSAQPRGQWSRASQPSILASWRNWKSPIATLRSQCLSGTQDFLGPPIRKSEEIAQAHQCEIHSDVGGADACFGKQHLTARAVADTVYGVIPVGSRQEFGTILQNCLPRGIPGAVLMSVTVPLKNL